MTNLPTWKDKQNDLDHRKKRQVDERLVSIGQQFEKVGRDQDALDYYQKAKNYEAIHRLFEKSIQEGDFFLFKQTVVFDSSWATQENISLALSNAKKNGKDIFATKFESYKHD
ncbi:MAG: hypothetical protein KDD46_01465 [Bdellovibrionales bacterium]|nr:hypothetical protein [Bdellovibrionales bacterium]